MTSITALILFLLTQQSMSNITDNEDSEEDSKVAVNSYEEVEDDQSFLHSQQHTQFDLPEPKQNEYEQLQDPAQPRSISVPTLGWAAVATLLIFAGTNTLIIGSAMAVTYALYNALLFLLNLAVPWVAALSTGLIWGVVG